MPSFIAPDIDEPRDQSEVKQADAFDGLAQADASLRRQHWPLMVALALLGGTLAGLLWVCRERNGGHLIYALDDPYIHLAIAKNLALHHVWGVDRFGFSSASSSLLWTVVLAAVYRLGLHDAAPLVLNLVFATMLLVLVHWMLRRRSGAPLWNALLLLAIAFCTPLPALIVGGMEHILHALLTLAFVWVCTDVLEQASDDTAAARPAFFVLLALASLVTAARYEGAFLIFVACLLFAARRRLGLAIVLGAAGAAPLIAFGLISLAQGWYFVPNSVLLKAGGAATLGSQARYLLPLDLFSFAGTPPSWLNFLLWPLTGIFKLVQTPHIAVLATAALAILYLRAKRHLSFWEKPPLALALFVGVVLLHMQFAATGSFFRYEAYLVTLGVAALGLALSEVAASQAHWRLTGSSLGARVAGVLAAGMVLLPLAARAAESLAWTPQATTNIYEQQYQMARFLKTFYREGHTAANDIGAINYFAGVHNLDLWGLSSLEVARAKRGHTFDAAAMRRLATAHGVQIAIVYDSWYELYGGLPANWVTVGKWTIAHNVVCGSDTVTFYAVDAGEARRLEKRLARFAPSLPSGVRQQGHYLPAGTGASATAAGAEPLRAKSISVNP